MMGPNGWEGTDLRFGFCAPLDQCGLLEKIGWDYIEPALVSTLAPEEPEGAVMPRLRETISPFKLRPEAYNVFLPGDLKVVGPQIDEARQDGYLRAAFARAAALGGQVVVFGSGRARQVPEGFSRKEAKAQVTDFVRRAAPLALEQGVTLAIEPLSATECNFINSVPEAVEIAQAVGSPAVGVLSDLYHVVEQGQPYSETREAGGYLKHVHIAGAEGRRAPIPADIDFLAEFFAVLKETDYTGRISIEGHWTDLAAEGPVSLETLRKAWQAA